MRNRIGPDTAGSPFSSPNLRPHDPVDPSQWPAGDILLRHAYAVFIFSTNTLRRVVDPDHG